MKGSDFTDDGDYDDNENDTDDKNVDDHDEYDNNAESNSFENEINYESDYRPSASVAQLVKKWILTTRLN